MTESLEPPDTRRQRFEAALAEVRRTDGFAGGERRWRRAGAVMMALGVILAATVFGISLRLADTRDAISMVAQVGLGVCLTVVGATLFVCHTITRALRLAVLRRWYETEGGIDRDPLSGRRRGPPTLAGRWQVGEPWAYRPATRAEGSRSRGDDHDDATSRRSRCGVPRRRDPGTEFHVSMLQIVDPPRHPSSGSRRSGADRATAAPHPAVPVEVGRAPAPDRLVVPGRRPDFDLTNHLHHDRPRRLRVTATKLGRFVGDLVSRPPRSPPPLWEVWFIDGLANGHVAVLSTVHHSIIDGQSGAELMAALYDLTPVPAPSSRPTAVLARPSPRHSRSPPGTPGSRR